jgi:hypothetical protein
MTPNEEFRFWVRFGGFMMSRQQRKGQALMNALREFPELYDMVTMSNADPFYQDSKIPAFCNLLGITEP